MVQLCRYHFKCSGPMALWWSVVYFGQLGLTRRERWRRSGQCRIVVYSRIVVIRCQPTLCRLLHQGGEGAGKEKGRCRSERLKCTCSMMFAVCRVVAGSCSTTRVLLCTHQLLAFHNVLQCCVCDPSGNQGAMYKCVGLTTSNANQETPLLYIWVSCLLHCAFPRYFVVSCTV